MTNTHLFHIRLWANRGVPRKIGKGGGGGRTTENLLSGGGEGL